MYVNISTHEHMCIYIYVFQGFLEHLDIRTLQQGSQACVKYTVTLNVAMKMIPAKHPNRKVLRIPKESIGFQSIL